MHLGGRLVASQGSEQGAAEGLSHRLALGAHLTSVSSSAAPEMLCRATVLCTGITFFALHTLLPWVWLIQEKFSYQLMTIFMYESLNLSHGDWRLGVSD